MAAMADDVWDWCEKTGSRGRTVTVKVKWATIQQSTRSRSRPAPIDSRAVLQAIGIDLVRSLFPPAHGVRLVGVALSRLATGRVDREARQLPLT